MDLTSDDEYNWVLLRERSLQPGGFGDDRARIWPALLGVQPLSDPPPYSEVDNANEVSNPTGEGMNGPADPHADERQIKLDTDRSFVLYPGESGTVPARDALQNDLHGLLVLLFRKRRSLHYFQGFHDIMTVLFLTLPRPLHLPCAEKLALHRVRDAMGVGLEPVLGLLRVLRNLLRLADPAYAKLLENTSPLPYHALSHLLTLFSHDIPTLPLIQHVWDFLLSREPIAVVWLAAALILHRKPSVYLLADQDEDGMIHSLLGGIPDMVDAEPQFYHIDNDLTTETTIEVDRATETETVFERSNPRSRSESGIGSPHERPTFEAIDEMSQTPNIPAQTRAPCDISMGDADGFNQSSFPPDAGSSTPITKRVLLADVTGQTCVDTPHDSTLEFAASVPLPGSRPASPSHSLECSPVQSTPPLLPEIGSHDHQSPLQTVDHVLPRSRSSSDLTQPLLPTQPPSVISGPPAHLDKFAPGKLRSKPVPLSLTSLLRQADELLTTHPPSHPLLRVTEIMGPDSVTRTWRAPLISATTGDAVLKKQRYDETDDYVATLVNSPHIVIPSPPPSPHLGPRLPVKKTRVSPREFSRSLLDPRRIGLRLGALTAAERRVLFMGALLVVGAAVALKSHKVPCVDGIVRASGGDGLKRLWNDKWTLMSSVVAAWGRGLP